MNKVEVQRNKFGQVKHLFINDVEIYATDFSVKYCAEAIPEVTISLPAFPNGIIYTTCKEDKHE